MRQQTHVKSVPFVPEPAIGYARHCSARPLHCVCHIHAAQSPEDKLIKLEHTLQGWKNGHLARMEMLFHYTSCEVCPPLPALPYFCLASQQLLGVALSVTLTCLVYRSLSSFSPKASYPATTAWAVRAPTLQHSRPPSKSVALCGHLCSSARIYSRPTTEKTGRTRTGSRTLTP